MNIVKRFVKSLYNFNSYKIFAKQSGFRAFIYALLLSIILGSVAYIKPTMDINALTKGMSKEIKSKVPQFVVKNEVLYIEGNKPVEINTEKSTFILNNTDNIESIVSKKNTGVFLGKDSLIIKENGIVKVNSKYSTINIEISRKMLFDFLPVIDSASTVYFVIMLVLFVLATYFKAFIMSILGVFFTKEEFGTRYKLSIYAITLPLVLSALMTAFNINFFGDSILLMLVGLCYLYFGSKKSKE